MNGKPRGCNEHPALGLLPRERTIKSLQFRTAHRALPALGLHVNLFQSQLVERDNAVDAGITRAAHTLQIVAAGAVPQAMKHIEHDHFKAVRADLQQAI
ncbi:hypothetical protein D3C80_1990780 [compost metagenome]